jgi:hypothetical protein
MKHTWTTIVICALASAAHAQPAGSGGDDAGSGSAVQDPYAAPPPVKPPGDDARITTVTASTVESPPAKHPETPEPPRPPDPDVAMPQLIATPTGWLLPAGVFYSRTGLDTSGGFTNDERVGLGDVAEFGLSTLDDIRTNNPMGNSPSAIQPYIAATFRMGVSEDRLFYGQPGLVIGFRKSFSRTDDDVQSRVAELTLVASKRLTSRVALHAGYAFWDASLSGPNNNTALDLRADHSLIDQLRPFGGIQVKPFERSEIMADVAWAPEFCYTCTTTSDQIRLSPELSWGVRYKATPWMYLESGVHVFDIDQARLLDAQIYGQVTFVSWGIRHAIDSIR